MPSIVWKGQLTFGLVSIPVKLYRAARREPVRMHYVHRAEVAEEPADEPEVSPPEVASRFAEQAPQRLEAFTASKAAPPKPVSEPPAPVSRVHQTLSTPEERPISRAEVLRGYEVEPDRYVVFDCGELKGLQRKTSATMEIVRSVRLPEIDPLFFETSYYVVPDRGVVIVRPGKHGMLAHTMFLWMRSARRTSSGRMWRQSGRRSCSWRRHSWKLRKRRLL